MRALTRRHFVVGLAVAPLGCKGDGSPASGEPQRIVSQVVDADEILWELGAGVRKRVVGVSSMADDERYTVAPGRWPSDVPRIAGKSEGLLAAKPDLIIVAEFSSPEVRALLQTSGINTLVLEGFDGFDDYRARARTIGKAVGAPSAAAELVKRFDARLAELTVERSTPRPAALSWVGGNVAGKGTSFDDLAHAAGLDNLAAKHDVTGHRQIPLEQLVAWDPDVLIVECGSPADCDSKATELKTAPGWSATTAARTDRVVAVPSRSLFSAGWGMLDALKWITTHTGGA